MRNRPNKIDSPTLVEGKKFIKRLLKDAQVNGMIYVKSESVAKQLREADPKVKVIYNKEDRFYTVTYN